MKNQGPLIPKDIYTPPDHSRFKSMPKSPEPQPEPEESGPIYKIEPINLKQAHGPGLGLILLVIFAVISITGILWWFGQQHKQKQAEYARQVLQQESQMNEPATNTETPPEQ